MADQPTCLTFSPNGWVPNNPGLPVLVWTEVEPPEAEDLAERFEERFEQNHWPPQWRDTVFHYHHFHSTTHEVMGVARGTATLMLGGPGGRLVRVKAGDALLLPAGTGHCRGDATEDFLAVGAYPPGAVWDICRDAPSPPTIERIRSLPHPETDPVSGRRGGLNDVWPSKR